MVQIDWCQFILDWLQSLVCLEDGIGLFRQECFLWFSHLFVCSMFFRLALVSLVLLGLVRSHNGHEPVRQNPLDWFNVCHAIVFISIHHSKQNVSPLG